MKFTRAAQCLLILSVCMGSLLAWADIRSAKAALKDKNYADAADEFRQLSRLGHSGASFEYAKLLQDKRVPDVDSADALAWFMLAVDQGHEKARARVKSLTRKLSEADRERARSVADELISHSGKETLGEALLPKMGGRPVNVVNVSDSPEFGWPALYSGRRQATLVHLEFDISEDGYPRDVRLVRDSRPEYVNEVLKAIRQIQIKDLAGLYAFQARYLYAVFDKREQYGSGRLLRKMRTHAKNGSPSRQYAYAYAQELAELYGYGYSERDSNKWFLESAIGGYTKAQYVVGYRVFFGINMERDIDKGWRWLSVAAGLGNARANYFVARTLMHQEGAEAALPYLEAAAEGGHTTAMLWLARMLAVSDIDAAVVWLNKATPHLDQVSWHLNAEEIYLKHDPEKSKMHRAEAEALAEKLDAHIEPLELIAWKERGAA